MVDRIANCVRGSVPDVRKVIVIVEKDSGTTLLCSPGPRGSSAPPGDRERTGPLPFHSSTFTQDLTMNLTRLIRGASATLALAMAAFTASAAPTTQLRLPDRRLRQHWHQQLHHDEEWLRRRAGRPADRRQHRSDDLPLSTGTVQVLAPTVVTGASIGGIISAVNGMAYTAGTTHTADGINAIAAAMLGSANQRLSTAVDHQHCHRRCSQWQHTSANHRSRLRQLKRVALTP